jgi:GT2 family glycosyltransferase
MIKNVFIYNPIRPDYIHRCLETLYKYTDMSQNRVIVVDQTLDGLQLDMTKVHLVLRPHRNLGFSKSMNEAIIHALYWGAEYITCANDDIEYMNGGWWQGILDTFEQYGEKVLAVNPESPRTPLWGYGRPHGEYIDIIGYKKEFSQEDYDYLLKGDFSDIDTRGVLNSPVALPATFPRSKSGVTDAIATWHTTFKAEFFEKIGLFEERYYPGGGEDYDINARAYRDGYRMLGATKSWVWHWWGSSKDNQGQLGQSLPIIDELRWLDVSSIWPPERNNGQSMDPWGKWTDDKGGKHPMYRDPKIGIIDI